MSHYKTVDAAHRVLLVSSSPLDRLLDGADKQLTSTIARRCPNATFGYFGAGRHRAGDPPGKRVPVLYGDGVLDRLGQVEILLAAAVLERRFDIVHVISSIGPGYARLSKVHASLRRWRSAPVIHTVPGVRRSESLAGATPLGLTVALTQTTAEFLRDAGFPDVRVIPPGISLDKWPSVPRRIGQMPTVLFAAHYESDTGWIEMVEAVGCLQRNERPVRLVMAMRTRPGQRHADQAAHVVELARAAGVEDLHIFDRIADMRALIVEADILALPARALAGKADVPLILLEAMASRRPVIVSDLPSLTYLGDAVRRVPPRDAGAIAVAVQELLSDSEKWDSQAARGRDLIEQEFADDVMAARYAALYDAVTAGTR